jgi:hypothetical protein
MLPLLSNGADELFVYVVPGGDAAPFVFVHGGDIHTGADRQSMESWLAWLCEAWDAERSLIRRVTAQLARSPMGWRELVLPLRAKRSFAAAMMRVAEGERFEIGARHIAFEPGAVTEVEVNRFGQLRVVLRAEDARSVSIAIAEAAADKSFLVPELGELRLAFSRWQR